MPDEKLTHLEQTVITFAVRRYRRPFYRWGEIIGWITIPLVGLCLLVPAFKPYQTWIGFAGFFCIFNYYSALVTRVIGKLATRLDAQKEENHNDRGS